MAGRRQRDDQLGRVEPAGPERGRSESRDPQLGQLGPDLSTRASSAPSISKPTSDVRSARVASTLASTEPDGLVVAHASKARSSRSRSSRSVRATTSAAWLKPTSVLCALVTIASAPSVIACAG